MIKALSNNSLSKNEFIAHLPKEVKTFFSKLEDAQFSLCLVGGAVRDYLEKSEVSRDLDLELRNEGIKDIESWSRKLSAFGGREIGLGVHQFEFGDFSVDLSPPRIESYKNFNRPYGHKDFDIHFDFKATYTESFKRRDFTLNALGLEFSGESLLLIDPFNGLKDLEEKKLVFCSDDFNKDPVRFLRAIRFHLQKGYDFDENVLEGFDLTELTPFYFFKEAFLVGAIFFSNKFFSLTQKRSIVVSEEIKSLSLLGGLNFESYDKVHLIKELVKSGLFTREKLLKFAKLLAVSKKAVP